MTVSKAVVYPETSLCDSPIDAKSPDENKRRPHTCLVVWGSSTIPDQSFHVRESRSLSIKYTMFSSEGCSAAGDVHGQGS